MTDLNQADASALPLLLNAARAEVRKMRSRIIRDLSWGGAPKDALSTAEVLSHVRDYSAAVLKVTSLEVQIEKHSSAICGVVQGGAINLDAARREVLDRIVRFRERSGD